MTAIRNFWGVLSFCFLLILIVPVSHAQGGQAGSVDGVVKDPSGAVVTNATVEITNPVSGFHREMNTGADGTFRFTNVPFNPYHMVVTANGFASYTQDVDIRSNVPLSVSIGLKIGTAAQTVNVEANGGDLVEATSIPHTDVDRSLFDKLPLESQSSSVSSLVTLSTAGVAADSNGLFHSLGDHASNSFSVDGQPITDQQSKVFSNQIPLDSVESLEVIQGAPPAEYGGKTSLIINVTTRSGLGVTQPTGSIYTSYGSFGSATLGFNLALGGPKWGNYVSASGLQSGRFLDPPEFTVMHDKGNEENFFDRVDYKLSNSDTLQLNLGFTRSWFQTPNSFDAQDATAWSGQTVDVTVPCSGGQTTSCGDLGPNGIPVGPQDQRSTIRTFNIAPSYTHLFGSSAVFTFGFFARQDQYNYLPSPDVFADLTPDLQSESIAQSRSLNNVGVRSDISIVKGIHNIKIGSTYEQTFLTEQDTIGIVDPTSNPVCENADGSINIDPRVTDPAQCGGPLNPGGSADPKFVPLLGCYDLTRTGALPASDGCPSGLTRSTEFPYRGHTDVKELALYLQDTITKGNWTYNLGIRGDFYNGLSIAKQAEPRVGVAYNIKKTNTVLRVSYARTLESPFNENLVISSTGCDQPVIADIMAATQGFPCTTTPIKPGWRNDFHAGFEQAFGRYLVLSGDYMWKYTHNAFDFNVLGTTPIYLPIEWRSSKIPGWDLRASMPNFHGLTALVVMSHVEARFFPPTVAGIGPAPPPGVFRIDHDENFNETTHLQYQPWKRAPWFGFNWRYDSGLVAGAVPCFADTATCAFSTTTLGGAPAVAIVNNVSGLPLSPDQQFQAGLTCNGVHATPTTGLPPVCLASQFGSTLISVPAPGTENDDHNPQRIAPRNLFDAAVGDDDLFHFHGDRYKWSLRFTVINLTNKEALYNFLSTFSGTHYVTPRTFTAELGFHF